MNDVHQDPRYLGLVPGVNSQLVVPLRHKKRVLGALNLLSDKMGAFSERDEQILSQFGVHIAQALANARMFEQARDYAETLETLTEISREVAEILDLDELLSRIAILAKRVIDYRTFGILLVNEAKQVLEPKVALQYGEKTSMLNIPIGEGLVGYSAQHKVPLVVEDVSKDPRYIKVLDDVRSELVVPLMLKERCLGVFDLESPELGAFTQRHAEILGILASQAAVAIENARLYETVRASELRLEREIEFARRVQSALLPTEPPKRLKGIELAARFEPARQIGGDLYDYLTPDPGTLVVAVGDVSGKGVPAALYGAFAGELVRSRTFRRRFTTIRSSPSGVLASMNAILHERQLEEYFCVLCYAAFDFKKRQLVMANSGLPYPIRRSDGVSSGDSTAGRAARVVPRHDLRGAHVRFKGGRLVCVLHRRHSRGRRSPGPGVRSGTVDQRDRSSGRSAGAGDCGRDFRGGGGLSSGGCPRRRHDGGGSEDNRLRKNAWRRTNRARSVPQLPPFSIPSSVFDFR